MLWCAERLRALNGLGWVGGAAVAAIYEVLHVKVSVERYCAICD